MNSFGKIFKITLYGESHQPAVGVLIDGMPAGIKLDLNQIKDDLEIRKPGSLGTTKRIESDELKIISGLFNEVTTGSPINLIFYNQDIKSKDYSHLIDHPRPNHADFVSKIKYNGFNDYRGGGRFSGRLTVGIVAAGAIAKQLTSYKSSYQILQIGTQTNPAKFEQYLSEVKNNGDSVGGLVRVIVKGLPVGLGEPMFDKLDALISQILFSIPAVKAVSFGSELDAHQMLGSVYNDVIINQTGETKTNHSGGVVGGLSNGNDLVVNIAVKPTPSIQQPQETYNFKTNQVERLVIGGRHDVAIIKRIGIVLENAIAIVLADLYLRNKVYQ